MLIDEADLLAVKIQGESIAKKTTKQVAEFPDII